jgi:hypothetical protein
MNQQSEQNDVPNIDGKGPKVQSFKNLPEDEHFMSLSDEERHRVIEIKKEIDQFYDRVPTALQASPEAQNRCLNYLLEAEQILAHERVSREDIIQGRLAVTRVGIEMARARTSRISFWVVGILVYIIAALVFAAFSIGLFKGSSTAEAMNEQLVIGIPLPVWIWAIIGSFTSMLLRAGQFPFVDLNEAMRWLLFRPIVGIIMGL